MRRISYITGGVAFAINDKAALVNYALLGTFNSTYYTDAVMDVERLRDLAMTLEPLFLAKLRYWPVSVVSCVTYRPFWQRH